MDDSTTKPRLEAIPSELRERKQWVLWRSEKQEDGKARKMPVSVSGTAGKSNDPATWATFEDAVGAVGKWSTCGIGYVFDDSDPYVGIDLDNALMDGEWAPWAVEVLDRFRGVAYGEISPSGQGCKLVTIGKKPHGARSSKKWDGGQGVECYDRVRFWTMTGQVLEGFESIGSGQESVDWLIGKYLAPPEAPAPRPKPAEPSVNGVGLLRRAERYAEEMEPAQPGDRNNAAFRNAGNLASLEGSNGERLTEEQVIELLRGWNARNPDPLPDDELVAAGRNGMSKGTPPAPKTATPTGRGAFYSNGDRTATPSNEFSIYRAECRTEAAVARRVAGEYAGRIRWCDPWSKWLIWDGRRWKLDDELRLEKAVKKVAAAIMVEAKEAVEWAGDDKDRIQVAKAAMSFAKAVNSRYGVHNIAALTRSEPGVPVRHDSLDSHPMLLNVANGTLDLTTGKLRPHNRDDILTKLVDVPFDEDASCPTWRKFLSEVFAGDEELIRFTRRAAGYSLTASTNERCLFFLYGEGKNGKTTLVSSLQKMLGDYATPVTTEMLMMQRGNQHPTELTDLAGRRMAVAVETEDGRRMAESFVKQITGGEDILKARRMREDFWSFMPTHKLWISGNHKPKIRGTDDGIWDRIRLIPFNVRFSEPDRGLPGRLESEWPGILAWCVAGALEWQASGLGTPEAVRTATDAYRREMDVVSQFLEACTQEVTGGVAYAGALYRAYCDWCKDNREQAITQRKFGSQLTKRYGKSRPGTGNRQCYDGLALTSGDELFS
jgi:putative DNA primase/helicase